VKKLHNEKLKPENLTASTRSPIIPVVTPTEKALIAKEREEKVKKAAERKAARLENEKAEAEKAKAGAEDPEAKKVPKKEPKTKGKKAELTFPATIRINHYGFVGIRKPLLAALGWHKDMALRIDKNSNGSVTMRKA
jgi:hypothetical protein